MSIHNQDLPADADRKTPDPVQPQWRPGVWYVLTMFFGGAVAMIGLLSSLFLFAAARGDTFYRVENTLVAFMLPGVVAVCPVLIVRTVLQRPERGSSLRVIALSLGVIVAIIFAAAWSVRLHTESVYQGR